MPVNIILLVKDRPNLTAQCLKTLYGNTPEDQFNVICMDDGSIESDTEFALIDYRRKTNFLWIKSWRSIGIVGFLRNIGAAASERYFGRGEYLYFSDNDIYFQAGWLEQMTHRMVACNIKGYDVRILGGYQHPFHGTNMDWGSFRETDAVAGYSMLMTWDTWDKYGPFDQHAKGVCQSEDFAICQKIIKNRPHDSSNGCVGYIHPPVIINCGLTNSEGKPAIGHEHFRVNTLENVIYE